MLPSQDDPKSIRLVRDGTGIAAPTGQERLIRALLTTTELTQSDQAAILSLPGRLRQLEPYEDIVSEGDRPNAIAIVVEGFVCRYKYAADGKRQIMSFHIPGDAPDLQSLYIDRMDHSVGTFKNSTILHIPHQAVYDLFKRAPQIAAVFWRCTLIDASIFREWVLNVGQRQAYSRIAHLLCETMLRMKAVGLAQGQTCELPITQADLGDATGLSSVHVNRSLQALRGDGLIRWEAGALTVLDWEGLKTAGDFDQAYLHLRQEVA